MSRRPPVDPEGGWVPVPDPTVLTTQALYREIEQLEGQVNRRMEAIHAELNSRLETLKEERTVLLKGLTDLEQEKFNRVEQQFELVERQRVEQKKDTKDAVDAALTAQKEAVREQTAASEKAIVKSETATNKLLEQLADTFRTEASSLRRSIDEVKERIADETSSIRDSIAAVDVKASGSISQRVGSTESRTGMNATIGLIATVVVAIVIVIGFIVSRGGAP